MHSGMCGALPVLPMIHTHRPPEQLSLKVLSGGFFISQGLRLIVLIMDNKDSKDIMDSKDRADKCPPCPANVPDRTPAIRLSL